MGAKKIDIMKLIKFFSCFGLILAGLQNPYSSLVSNLLNSQPIEKRGSFQPSLYSDSVRGFFNQDKRHSPLFDGVKRDVGFNPFFQTKFFKDLNGKRSSGYHPFTPFFGNLKRSAHNFGGSHRAAIKRNPIYNALANPTTGFESVVY